MLPETARVRCNVRCFRQEEFWVWRCPGCASIHARDEVDLDHYYGAYPKFPVATERVRHAAFSGMVRRLVAAGLRPEHHIIDYGCASGALVRYLKQRGYPHVWGYDPYTVGFDDPGVLDRTYDCVLSQDVIEHVAEPLQLLADFDALAAPSALVVIGTPDAAAIDLADPESYVHALHAPYHRHILSAKALRAAGEERGWTLERFYSTMYANRLLPGENARFGLHYMRVHDDCLDLLTEPMKLGNLRLWSPRGWFLAMFGYFLDRHTDVQFVFRRSAGPGADNKER
ncbi:MAG: class I SAM-dependent methyltransferase [Myxococcales bacterium]|nr:class I SAM-dependent methyltransferase [Myxococcales bacterium]